MIPEQSLHDIIVKEFDNKINVYYQGKTITFNFESLVRFLVEYNSFLFYNKNGDNPQLLFASAHTKGYVM